MQEHVVARDGRKFSVTAATDADHDELFRAFSAIVEAGEGYPQAPPLSREDFGEYWIAHKSLVAVVRDGSGRFAGSYYIKPNFPGRGAHICNAGYFVVAGFRGAGLGEALVEHSLSAAKELGFDAMQYNLVFASNPARPMYERLGFEQIGRVPEAIDGEDCIIYWKKL